MAQILGKRGAFREAIKEVRSCWRIDVPPIKQLPEPEGDVLLPPVLSTPSVLSDLHAAWAHHPHLPPLMEHPGSQPADSIMVWPSDEHTALRNLTRQWQNDLKYALQLGGVPERYLEGPSPHADYPPTSTQTLPWLRFAAACVLCDVPVLDAPKLAEVGGVPSLQGDVEGEFILGVIGPRQQRERDIAVAVREAYDAKVVEKLWTLRSEVGDDLGKAKREVIKRFGEELQNECDQARERTERWLDWNPPRKYLIEFDPEVDKPADIEKTVDAVLAEIGVDPQAHGSLQQGDLVYVMIARLLEQPGSTEGDVAIQLGLSTSTVTRYGQLGRGMLDRES